ncbi:MAG: class I SAM-dependent methyltransferase [Propionibacteriaceae bacterium]|nr:class I SAM-dependent methyltransferase [Propionibacteriaceae bacterium]
MEQDIARWLVSPDAAPHIDLARRVSDPTSLAAGAVLRKDLPGDRAAAVLDQEALRRRGRTKLGDMADQAFLTHDGLEQATRAPVAAWRAEQIASLGVERVVDAGCGLGMDAIAMCRAGLSVVGIDADPVTATFAQENLRRLGDGQTCDVLTRRLEDVDIDPWLADPATAIFLDPARRTMRGRSWDVADLSPSWDTVSEILARSQGVVVVKLAPGFPRHVLPDHANITWVSHHNSLVETTLWSWPLAQGVREAVILADHEQRLIASHPLPAPGPLDRYIYEPDPAVIRSSAIGALARLTSTHPVAPSIAYLTGPRLVPTVFATAFEVLDTLDFSEKTLRGWVRDRGIGTLEIKVRGLDVDPAVLRRRLHPQGKDPATLILTPTTTGARALVVQRV